MTMQQPLWHDTLADAVRALVEALGGAKRVGSMLWPAKPLEAAQRHLLKATSGGKERLSLDELDLLLEAGRAHGCHVVAHYVGQRLGYRLVPVEPEDERAALQRKYIAAVDELRSLTVRLGQVEMRQRSER